MLVCAHVLMEVQRINMSNSNHQHHLNRDREPAPAPASYFPRSYCTMPRRSQGSVPLLGYSRRVACLGWRHSRSATITYPALHNGYRMKRTMEKIDRIVSSPYHAGLWVAGTRRVGSKEESILPHSANYSFQSRCQTRKRASGRKKN